jgi:molybdate transport system ATP-binding protein
MTAHPKKGLGADLDVTVEQFRLQAAFSAEPGETIAVLGPNGAGKSTTVRSLTGLAPMDAGRIELGGRVLDDPAAKTFVLPHERSIGTAFQDALLFPHLDVRDNVGFGLDRSQRGSAVDALLERVGLAGFGARSVDGLSGGEARRVAIARALAGDPDLVILDEPFAGLDVGARAGLRKLILERRADSDAPWLLITHDPTEARILADRVVVLEAGQVTQVGTPSEVQAQPASRYVAELVGVNLFEGVARAGRVTVGSADVELTIVDSALTGEVRLTAPPESVALHASQPGGSPRNAWEARVAAVHRLGDLVRVHVDSPLPLVADVTPGAVTELDIAPGETVWVAIKATSFDVF